MDALNPTQQWVAKTCYDTFRSLGWSHAACCGLLAMALGESSFNPKVIGDHGTAFGLWQEHGDRCSAILKAGWSMKNGSVADQCHGVNWELEHPEHMAGSALKLAKTPAQAATVLVELFERPGNKPAAVARRIPYAEAFDQMFADRK